MCFLKMEGGIMVRSLTFPLVSALLTVFKVVLLLLIELISTMLIYMYLNFYHIDTFGHLVRLARYPLDLIGMQMEYWLPASANTAYATLIGELGPKSFMLLTLGLIVAAIIRSGVSFGATMMTRPHRLTA
jgi:hypothetical protein